MTISPEPRGFLLGQHAGWQALHTDPTLQAADTLRLRPVPGSGQPLADSTGGFGGLADATGLALGPDGTVYVLDPSTPALWYRQACDDQWRRAPCLDQAGPQRRQVRDPHGLAATPWGDLVVADTGNRRLQVLAVHGWVLRSVWGPYRVGADTSAPPTPVTVGDLDNPPPGTWLPWDAAVRPDGSILITDTENGLLHRFDRTGRWLEATDGSGPDHPPMTQPTHLAVDDQGQAYVVQRGRPTIRVLAADGSPVRDLDTDQDPGDPFTPSTVGVDPDGGIFVLDHTAGQLRHYGTPHTTAAPAEPYVVCCVDGPCGTPLAIRVDGTPIMAGPGDTPPRTIETRATLARRGTLTAGPFDSLRLGCRWHRVRLRADVPSGTRIEVHTYTSDAEKTPAEVRGMPEAEWATDAIHDHPTLSDWDCLVRGMRGRYLWLRLTVVGDGTHTPVLHHAMVTGPRQSTLRYLPAIYRQDADSEEFLDRLLSVFDRPLDDIAQAITGLPRYLDPATTPADPGQDFLSWLASWVGLSFDRAWPVDRRRAWLAEAVSLYARRGTVDGLLRMLALFLGHDHSRVLEHYRLRRWLSTGTSRLGDRSVLWGDEVAARLHLDHTAILDAGRLVDTDEPHRDPLRTHAHQFTVFVPSVGDDPLRRHAIERIIATTKPAHTLAYLSEVHPRFRVGHALVGMDTVVAAQPCGTVTGHASLGYDSVLQPDQAAAPPSFQVGQRQVGRDTVLD